MPNDGARANLEPVDSVQVPGDESRASSEREQSGQASRPESRASISDLSERELIGRIHKPLPAAPDWLVVGIGDDAAVVEPERNRLEVLSVDALVEGVHFDRAFTPPAAIGHRALAVNLSDLAAMGATPRLALVSLALPPTLLLDDFDEMIRGLTDLAIRYRVTIAGGNLTRIDGPLVADVTVVGTVKRRQVLTRAGAMPGDELYVTGSVGGAAAGLDRLQSSVANRQAAVESSVDSLRSTIDSRQSSVGSPEGASDPVDSSASSASSAAKNPASSAPSASSRMESCIHRYLFPEPRIRMGSLLGRNRAASACIDLSDGLAEAVHQLAEASGVGATIDAGQLPLAAGARAWFAERGRDPIERALAGGDDYELLIAVRPRLRRRLAAAQRHGDVPLTRIGACTADRRVLLRRDGTDHPVPRGFAHFR